MMRLKKNDTVLVVTGKDKGKRGTILAVDQGKERVMVQGVAVVTRHTKARRAGEKAGIYKQESFVALSNVMPICSSCNKPCRVNFASVEGSVVKERVCNRCKVAF